MSQSTVQSLGEEQTPGHDGRSPSGPGPVRPQPLPSVRLSTRGGKGRGAGARVAAAEQDADGTPDWLRGELGAITAPERVLGRPI